MSKNEEAKICATCDNCIYIGEGDYICDIEQEIVMEDHCPNDYHLCCSTADWESSNE